MTFASLTTIDKLTCHPLVDTCQQFLEYHCLTGIVLLSLGLYVRCLIHQANGHPQFLLFPLLGHRHPLDTVLLFWLVFPHGSVLAVCHSGIPLL